MLNHTLFYEALVRDLVADGALSPDIIKGLVRHFNVIHDDYVDRVSEWQKFLVAQRGVGLRVGPLLVRAGIASVKDDVYTFRSDALPCAVADVHQIAMLFWKEEVPVEPDWDSYRSRVTVSGTPVSSDPIIGKLRRWVRNLLGKAPTWDQLFGRAGSGATADHLNLRDRWAFGSIPLGVPDDFFRYNGHDDSVFNTDVVLTARASAVPKNRKSARIVASETSAAMFAQLAIMDAMDKKLAKYRKRLPIRDADMHRKFLVDHADEAVTIDLSDASDYISMDLASIVLPTDWFALLNACRSQAVRLPDGSVERLATYAPMGNGYCFRLLSLVCLGILAVCCTRLYSDFGDDMICLHADANRVLYALQACGLKVSTDKTCFDAYKETCGLELWRGYNITPFKPKKLLTFGDRLMDLGAAARAAARGLSGVASLCVAGIDKVPVRYNRRLQRLERRFPVWITRALEVKCDGWPGLQRWLRQRGKTYRNEVPQLTRTKPGFRWCDSFADALSEEVLSSSELRSLLLSLQTVDRINRTPTR